MIHYALCRRQLGTTGNDFQQPAGSLSRTIRCW